MATSQDRELLHELVGLHARVLLRMPLVVFLIVAAIAFQAREELAPQQIGVWASMVLLVELVRAYFAHGLLNGRFDPRGAHVHRTLILLAGIAGFTVGISAIWFFPYLTPEKRALLALIHFR